MKARHLVQFHAYQLLHIFWLLFCGRCRVVVVTDADACHAFSHIVVPALESRQEILDFLWQNVRASPMRVK